MSKDDTITTDANSSREEIMESTAVNKTRSIFQYLLKKWWLFMIVGLLAAVVGIWYAARQKISYQSRLTFALDNGGSESSLLSLASQFGLTSDDGKDIFAGDNILEIMKSRRMVEKVLLSSDTFNNQPYTLLEYFLKTDGNTNPRTKDIHFPVGEPRESFSYLQDSILYSTYTKFATQFIIAQRVDRKLSLFEVDVTSADERFTKVFTDRIVSETNNFYIEISSKKAKKTLDVLEERVESMKGNLGASISSRAATQDANLNPVFAESQVPVIKQQFNMQAYSGAYAEMFKNLEMARFQYLKKIPLMQVIDTADYPMKKIKASKLITAIQFALLACMLLTLLLWVIRLLKK